MQLRKVIQGGSFAAVIRTPRKGKKKGCSVS